MEYARDHPNAKPSRRMEQHRLVMECVLGRLLETHEVVHHKNHTPWDNRAENLELMTAADHLRLHVPDSRAKTLADLDEPLVREALQGRTTLQAASLLGVHHMTLRNRFGHLLVKRRSPGAPFPGHFVEAARKLAADRTVGARKAAMSLGVTESTLRACCHLHGIPWTSAPLGRPSRKQSVSGGQG